MGTLYEWSRSVCHIVYPGGSGTGFRVGPNYIMTAKHVLEAILQQGFHPVNFNPGADRLGPLRHDTVYAVFDYLKTGHAHREENKFYFEKEVLFEDEKTDTTILKLKPNVTGAEMPTPFINFSIPKPGGKFWLIGHSNGEPKEFNAVDRVPNMSSRDTLSDIAIVINWSQVTYDRDYEHYPYETLKNNARCLFHSAFTKGASGSPGIAVLEDSRVVVVTMLIHGYPDWYYRPDIDSKVKASVTLNKCIEQGASMSEIYNTMKITHPTLCSEIFGIPDISIPV